MPVLITNSTLDLLLPSRPASVVRMDIDWKEIAKHEPRAVSQNQTQSHKTLHM